MTSWQIGDVQGFGGAMFQNWFRVVFLVTGLVGFSPLAVAQGLPQDIEDALALARAELAENDVNGLVRLSNVVDDLRGRQDVPEVQRNQLIWSLACDIWTTTLNAGLAESQGHDISIPEQITEQIQPNYIVNMELPASVATMEDVAFLYRVATCRDRALQAVLNTASVAGPNNFLVLYELAFTFSERTINSYVYLMSQSDSVVSTDSVDHFGFVSETAMVVIRIADFYQVLGGQIGSVGIQAYDPDALYSAAETDLLSAQQRLGELNLDQSQVWFDITGQLTLIHQKTNDYEGVAQQAARLVNYVNQREGASSAQAREFRQQFEDYLIEAPDSSYLSTFRRLIE